MNAVLDCLERCAHDANPPILVGYSGGLDSTVLLHALAATRASGVRAIHVHHGLHSDADRWAAHCRDTCAALGIALAIVPVRVKHAGPNGPEASARAARHAAFAAALGEGETLALGHHLQDQAETFLLRALRGSGPDGLAGMRGKRRFARGWLWRPLLAVPRDALHEYATSHALRWIEDASNADHAFDRNFLRHRILPLLRERWPGADRTLARDAALQGEASELLAGGDALALAQVRTADPHALSVERLLAQPRTRRARLLRLWTAGLGLEPLPAEGVARIERDLLVARRDARAAFAWAGCEVLRWRDLLHGMRRQPPLPPGFRIEWTGAAPLQLPHGDRIALGTAHAGAGFDANVSVHARQGGERIVLPGRTHSHALKHVLQDLGVPPWERRRLPLVSDQDGRLLAAGDLVYAAHFDAWLRERGTRLVWSRASP